MKPLICDMSSDFLSQPIRDIQRYGMIYAGSHKNVGPAGMVIVIIRKDIAYVEPKTQRHATFDVELRGTSKTQLYTEPPQCSTFYFAGLTFLKLIRLGGLNEMERVNREKATFLYPCIERILKVVNC